MSNGAFAEAEMTVRRGGQRALFIVEVGNAARARQLLAYFASAPCEVRPIAVGPVVVCAAWARDDAGSPLEKMAEHLRDTYSLSICEPGFTASMYRVALQLARDAEGEMRPLDRCCLCGAPEPFPTRVEMRDCGEAAAASFCPTCVDGVGSEDPEGLCRGLMRRAGGALAAWSSAPADEPHHEGDTLRLRLRGKAATAAAV